MEARALSSAPEAGTRGRASGLPPAVESQGGPLLQLFSAPVASRCVRSQSQNVKLRKHVEDHLAHPPHGAHGRIKHLHRAVPKSYYLILNESAEAPPTCWWGRPYMKCPIWFVCFFLKIYLFY